MDIEELLLLLALGPLLLAGWWGLKDWTKGQVELEKQNNKGKNDDQT